MPRTGLAEISENSPLAAARRMPRGPASRTVSPVAITALGAEVVPGSIGCQDAPPLDVLNRPPRWSSAYPLSAVVNDVSCMSAEVATLIAFHVAPLSVERAS